MTTADIVGIIIAVVLVAAFAAGAFGIMANRRALHERFGDEYDAVIRTTGSRAAAESELRRRTRAHRNLTLKEIPEAERARFHDLWTAAQARFVDDPSAAVRDADRIVAEIVADRGYPVVDFPDRVAHLSVDHTGVLADYRAGHEIAVRNDAGRATTEELRQALVHYREVYTDLLGDIAPDTSPSRPRSSMVPLTLDSDQVAVYAPADPVPPGERIRAATDAADLDADPADVGASDADFIDGRAAGAVVTAEAPTGSAKRRINGARMGAAPTTEDTDATSASAE